MCTSGMKKMIIVQYPLMLDKGLKGGTMEHALEINESTSSQIEHVTSQYYDGLITKLEMHQKVTYMLAEYLASNEPVLIKIFKSSN